jgi:hypothetical protein
MKHDILLLKVGVRFSLEFIRIILALLDDQWMFFVSMIIIDNNNILVYIIYYAGTY